MIGLLNLSILGFSFVFHDKGKRTQHGNLLEMIEKDDWPGREFSRWRRRGKIPMRGSAPIQPLRKWSTRRTDLKTTKIEVSWFFPFHNLCWNWWQVESRSEVHSRSRIRTSPRVPPRPESSPPKEVDHRKSLIFSPWSNWLHWNCQTQSAVYRVSIRALHSSQVVQRENGLWALSALHANSLPF